MLKTIGKISLTALLFVGILAQPSLSEPESSSFQIARKPIKFSREKRRVQAKKGFSIIPPTGWKKSSLKKSKYILVYKAAPRNRFAVNLNVSANPDGGIVIKSVGPALKKQFSKQFDKWKLGEDGHMTINGHKAYYISSKFSMKGYRIQNLQFLLKNKKKKVFYIVTFTALEKDYKAKRAAFMRAAKSIKLN